jgi:thymidylate synthase
LGCGRKLSPRIAAAEALQLVGGFSDPAWLCRIAPQFKRFREDFNVDISPSPDRPSRLEPVPWFHGAYGNRITRWPQLETVVRRLRESPSTRQAVVTLWDPALDAVSDDHLDYPCTVALNFRRTGKHRQKLSLQVLMRSNDCWLGLPYDINMFTQLQLTLCNVLALEPGTYTHTAWSAHLYHANLDASYDVTDNAVTRTVRLDHVTGVGREYDTLAEVRQRAHALALEPEKLTDPTESEKWYLDVLSSTR